MRNENDLNTFFEAERKTPPEPSMDFMARILQDAQMHQPAPLGVMSARAPKRSVIVDFFGGLGDMIGGWPGFAGLASAAVAGVWIGVSPPDTLLDPINTVLGGDTAVLSETLSSESGFDFTLFEG